MNNLWLFFTTSSDSSRFQEFVGCLNEGNQWAKHSAVIGFIIARKFFKSKPRENSLADFDCGAAWMALTIHKQDYWGTIHTEWEVSTERI